VSKWENGKGYPDLPTLQALAKLYGVSVDSLVGVEEYESAEKSKSIHPSPYFAFVLFLDLILLIVSDFASGSFVRLFRDFLDNVGNTRMMVFVSAGFFFLSCIALVFLSFGAKAIAFKSFVLANMTGFSLPSISRSYPSLTAIAIARWITVMRPMVSSELRPYFSLLYSSIMSARR